MVRKDGILSQIFLMLWATICIFTLSGTFEAYRQKCSFTIKHWCKLVSKKPLYTFLRFISVKHTIIFFIDFTRYVLTEYFSVFVNAKSLLPTHLVILLAVNEEGGGVGCTCQVPD